MNLEITYSDSISPPWPAQSTFDCWRKNANTDSTRCLNAPSANPTQFQFDPGCSTNIWDTSLRSLSWDCTYDLKQLPGFSDGKWYYCVIAADWAVPDNPYPGDPTTAHTGDEANLSSGAPDTCGAIVLDRSPPTVTPHAGATTVQVGQLVNFSVSASDPVSGISGQYSWDFGDNTASGSGATPAHTYTQPGTYQVTATTRDGAGNAGSGHITIAVNPRSTQVKPVNKALPTISGAPRQGQTLTAGAGSWTGNPTSFTYRWRDCDRSGNNCSNISGASRTHALTGADVGHTIRVVVTASNAAGSTSATSARTAAITPPAPSISNVKLGASTFRASVGTTLKLSLSQRATVRVQALKSGVAKAQQSFTGQAGGNSFHIRFPTVRPGHYTLSITARNGYGLTSKAVSLAIVIR